ncbi:hypothetical protein ACH492_20885 [Streptomyces sp. NPDC019443]|uniref:hypothetical protein n=1 Tax=Streptomyces sp. NPDC019443 TaxID=3365061 RepID=UPI0037B7EEB6
MPDTAALFAAASEQQGLGNALRILLIASIAGAAVLAWFLLRGYRGNGADDQDND